MDPGMIVDAESESFWDGVVAGEWRLCSCVSCGALRFPPSAVCHQCGAVGHNWVPAAGTGTLYASTVIHRPPSPFWEALAPYAVGLIELDEGPRVLCTIFADDLTALRAGGRMRLCFRETDNGPQPYFSPDGGM
jgi:uncharacterized OB-fold protein